MKLKSLLPENLNESSLSRVVHHMAKHDCGTITAHRAKEGCGEENDKAYSIQDNKKRNIQLRARLESLGYGVTDVDGSYIENFGKPNAIEWWRCAGSAMREYTPKGNIANEVPSYAGPDTN
jgi:hypothetical protein